MVCVCVLFYANSTLDNIMHIYTPGKYNIQLV